MKSFKIVFSLGLVIALSGCLQTREEVNEMETGRQAQAQVSAMQKAKAEEENRLYVLQDELRQANGRIDVLEKRLSDAQEKLEKNQNSGPSNKDIIDQMKIFEQSLTQLKNHVDELETKIASSKAQKESANKDPWAAAEEAYSKKEWKNAILNYQAYRDQNPKGANYPVATYKIGVSFQELKMIDEAQAFFQEVIHKFPKSPSAKKAKFRLSQMK